MYELNESKEYLKNNEIKSFFKNNNIFKKYEYNIEMKLFANNNLDLKIWKGFVESKIISLVLKIENTFGEYVYPYIFPLKNSEKKFSLIYYLSLEKSLNLSNIFSDFILELNKFSKKNDDMFVLFQIISS
jgi:poly(A) polymerase Pap1